MHYFIFSQPAVSVYFSSCKFDVSSSQLVAVWQLLSVRSTSSITGRNYKIVVSSSCFVYSVSSYIVVSSQSLVVVQFVARSQPLAASSYHVVVSSQYLSASIYQLAVRSLCFVLSSQLLAVGSQYLGVSSYQLVVSSCCQQLCARNSELVASSCQLVIRRSQLLYIMQYIFVSMLWAVFFLVSIQQLVACRQQLSGSRSPFVVHSQYLAVVRQYAAVSSQSFVARSSQLVVRSYQPVYIRQCQQLVVRRYQLGVCSEPCAVRVQQRVVRS